MYLNYLRQLEIKPLVGSRYNVYQNLVSAKSKKSVLFNGLAKKDLIVNKPIKSVLYNSKTIVVKKVLSQKVLFERVESSYLGKKLLYRFFFINFLKLKKLSLSQPKLKRISSFSAIVPKFKLRSRNLYYSWGQLLFIFGKSFVQTRRLSSLMSRKLPFKIFRLQSLLRKIMHKILFFFKNINRLKLLLSINFSKALYKRVFVFIVVILIGVRQSIKLLRTLVVTSFIRHKFSISRRFNFLAVTLKKIAGRYLGVMQKAFKPYIFSYVLYKRKVKEVLLYKFSRLLRVKVRYLRNKYHIYLSLQKSALGFLKVNLSYSVFNNLGVVLNFIYKNFLNFSRLQQLLIRRLWFKFLKKFSLKYSMQNLLSGSRRMFCYSRNSVLKFLKNGNRIGIVVKDALVGGKNLFFSKGGKGKSVNDLLHAYWKLLKFRRILFFKILRKLRFTFLKSFSKKKVGTNPKFKFFKKTLTPYVYSKAKERRQRLKFKNTNRYFFNSRFKPSYSRYTSNRYGKYSDNVKFHYKDKKKYFKN
jgi:hypothetical protein